MNFKRLLFYVLLVVCLPGINGCKKFLDINPSSTTINPTTIKEFQELLNSDSLSRVNFFLLDLMTDDIKLTDAQYTNKGDTYFRRDYLWGDTYWNPAQDDYMYNSSYTRILQMNVILDKIKTAPADALNTPKNNSVVISQALINRAWYYLQLVNTYGKAYDATTAATDLAVPIVLTPTTDILPSRASVQDVYARVMYDLKTAVTSPYLAAKGSDIIHPGKAAGFGLLARASLYKSDYDAAAIYADSALRLASTLLDLTKTTYYPGLLQALVPNPEVLVGRFCTETNFFTVYGSQFTISPALRDSLGGPSTADLRYTQRFYRDVYNTNASNTASLVFDNSVSVPEIMLIKAECLARKGDVTGASTLLTQLRAARIPATVVTKRIYSAGNILPYVLGERRRELCFRGGLRLFDLKRLNKDDRFKQTLTRVSAAGVVWATLAPGSPRYLIPFSPNVIIANSNIVQNPR